MMSRNNISHKNKQTGAISIIALSALLFCGSSCSPRKTTRASLIYHSLTTRYNVLYNAQKLFDETYQEQLMLSRDTTAALIPTIASIRGNEISYTAVVSKLHRAVEEHSLRSRPKWVRRNQANGEREYNPALFDVWLLLGKSLLLSAKPQDAEQVFAFTSRLYQYDRLKSYQAKIWRARALLSGGRAIDAELLIRDLTQLEPTEIQKLRDVYYILLAEHAIEGQDWTKAIESLSLAIKHSRYKAERTRLSYLLGQLLQLNEGTGSSKEALRAYSYTLRHSGRGGLYTQAKRKIHELRLPANSSLQIDETRPDTTTQAVVPSRASETLGKEYHPINWGRIFEQSPPPADAKASTPLPNERSCFFEVLQSDISYADLFFVLSSHNFINFTQESLQIINNTIGEDLYSVEVKGFSSEIQRKAYIQSLVSVAEKHQITLHLTEL